MSGHCVWKASLLKILAKFGIQLALVYTYRYSHLFVSGTFDLFNITVNNIICIEPNFKQNEKRWHWRYM